MTQEAAVPQTAMAEAMRKAEARKTTKKGKGTLNVDEAAVRLKKMMAFFVAKKDAESISEEEKGELIDMAEFAADSLKKNQAEISQINEAVKNGIPVDAGRMPELQKQSAELRQCYDALTSTHSWIVAELTKRASKRQRVSEFRQKVARLKLGETKFADIRDLVGEIERTNLAKKDPSGIFTLGFGERAVSYGPADDAPEEATLLFAEIADFIGKFNEEKATERKTRMAEVAEYLFVKHDDDEGGKERLEEAKRYALKSLPDFVEGEGNVIFIPVDDKYGFAWEVMVVRQGDGSLLATHATHERAAHKVFGFFKKDEDTDQWAWQEKGAVEVAFVPDDELGISFEPTRNRPLKKALQAKFAKDMAFKKRKETSERLRDVSRVENPITMAEALRGEPGTSVVHVLKKGKDDDKGLWVTLHLVSDGDEAHISVYEPEDLMKKLPWLQDYLESKPVEVFSNDHRWQKIAESNRDHFEAGWLLTVEAEKRGAVELSKENVETLSAIKGGDGFYALTRATTGFDRKPLRVIMQKKGDTVAVVWAAPGASTRALTDRNGKSAIGEFYPMNDLPKAVRGILRNQYRYFLGLGGDAGFEKVPAHLKDEEKSSDAEDGADD